MNIKDYSIVDCANVCMLYPIKKGQEEFKELETELGLFKIVEKPEIKLDYEDLIEGEAMSINGTRISKYYINQIKKIADVWCSLDKLKIFMRYDKKKFLKDHPVMFIFDYKMCFIIAPRIDNDENSKDSEVKG